MSFEDKFIMVHIDNLLGDVEVRHGDDLAEEQDLALSQLEHETGLQTSTEEDVADERPVLDTQILLLTLKLEFYENFVLKRITKPLPEELEY